MFDILQTLDDQGIRCQQILDNIRGTRGRATGHTRNWLLDRLQGIQTQISRAHLDNIIRKINDWGAEQIRHGVRARPNVDRALLPVYNSLMAFKQYLFKALPRALEELGTETRTKAELEVVADDYHRSLAMLEFSHYSLKSEYDKGEARFRGRLGGHLREISARLPASVNKDSLVDLCVKYFRSSF